MNSIMDKFDKWVALMYPNMPPKKVLSFLSVMALSVVVILVIAYNTLVPIVGSVALFLVVAMAWIAFKRYQYLHQKYVKEKGEQE